MSASVATALRAPVKETRVMPAAVQAYLRCGYSALSHSVVDHWMPKLSGAEFKLIIFMLRATVGDREKRFTGDLSARISLDEISTYTGLNRESAIAAIRGLEDVGLLTAARAHRQTTVYGLDLTALLDPWVEKTDSTDQTRVGQTDSTTNFRVGNTDSNNRAESEKPTQNGAFEPGFPTPYKELNKAAAAISASNPTRAPEDFSQAEVVELRRIEETTGIRVDGKDAKHLKAGVERAALTLAHLRWFLTGEKFSSARSPRAVLLTIAKEFNERSKGIKWPNSLDPPAIPNACGLTREELLDL